MISHFLGGFSNAIGGHAYIHCHLMCIMSNSKAQYPILNWSIIFPLVVLSACLDIIH